MSVSDHDQLTTPTSQRPTMEIVDDSSLQFATVPPSGSGPPSSPLDRPTVPGAPRSSWSAIAPSAGLPFEFELRLLIGILRALTPMHTNLLVAPHERAYGRVCRPNVVVDPDGDVRLLKKEEAREPSGDLQAPEVLTGDPVDQQADLYSVGALLLAALGRTTESRDALRERVRAIATRAVRLDRQARWTSASEFANELEQAAGDRLPSKEAFVEFLRDERAKAKVRACVRPSVTSIPDADIELLEPATDDDEDPDGAAALVPLGSTSFDPRFAATSKIPGERSHARRSRPLFLLLAGASLALVAGGAWALMHDWSEGSSPTALEAKVSPGNAELVAEPETQSAEEPAQQDPAGETARGPVRLRPRPTVTAVLPPVPATSHKASAARAPAKRKPPPVRPTTYDPEGI